VVGDFATLGIELAMENHGIAAGAGSRRGRRAAPGTDGRILDAAIELLAAHGYGGFTLDGLAVRAGVAKTTILRRWPSKAAIAAAAVERLALQTVDLPESDSLRGDLQALVTSAVAAFAKGRGRFVPRLMRESGNHPEIADLLRGMIHTRRLAYRRVLARAVARGELHPDVDQDLVIDLLVGPVWTRLLITQDPIPETLVDEIVDAVLRAFAPRAATAPKRPPRAAAAGAASRPDDS
jgi:AcrR family transcriptional regulator